MIFVFMSISQTCQAYSPHHSSIFQVHFKCTPSTCLYPCKPVRLVPCTQHSPSCSIFLYPQAHCPPIPRFHHSPSYISSFMHSVHAFSLYSTSLIPISPPKASHFSRHLFSLYTTPLHTPPFLTYLHHYPTYPMHHQDAQGPLVFFEIHSSHLRPIKGLNL